MSDWAREELALLAPFAGSVVAVYYVSSRAEDLEEAAKVTSGYRAFPREGGVGHQVMLSTHSSTLQKDLADAAFNALYRTGRFTEAEWAALTDPRLLAHWRAAGEGDPGQAGARPGGGEAEDIVCFGFSRAWRDGARRGRAGSEIHLPESDSGDPGLAEAARRAEPIFRAVADGIVGRRPADPEAVRDTLTALGYPDPPGPGARYARAPERPEGQALSVYSDNPEEDLPHEAFHALRRTGRFSEEEWTALVHPRLIERWREQFGIDDLYGQPRPDLALEESSAARFARAWLEAAAAGDGGDLRIRLTETEDPDPEIAAPGRQDAPGRAKTVSGSGSPGGPSRASWALSGPNPGQAEPKYSPAALSPSAIVLVAGILPRSAAADRGLGEDFGGVPTIGDYATSRRVRPAAQLRR